MYFRPPEYNPYHLVLQAETCKKMIADAGLPPVEIFIGEWNMSAHPTALYNERLHGVVNASALAYLQDAPVTSALFFRADRLHIISSYKKSDDVGMTIWYDDGDPRPGAYGFYLVGQLLRETPVRLKAEGGDEQGYAVLAGQSEDGDAVDVLISNFNAAAKGYSLEIGSLPWGETDTYTVEVISLDDRHANEVVEQTEGKGKTFHAEAEIEAPFARLYRISSE
jgi:hypothetical protein